MKPSKSQPSFADLPYLNKKKVTRREKFLAEMEQVIPWERMLAVIRPHYPVAGNGRRPMPLEKMLRVYCLQQWFALSDPATEEALYDSTSMRGFAGFELGEEAIPDETTILHFRHLLEKHNLTEAMFEATTQYLKEQGLILQRGTIVDATIIHAPSSTKNSSGDGGEGARDPEMRSTKKGNQWHFGMKAHVGADSEYGLIHTVKFTAANEHDSTMLEELLHGQEKAIYGDKAYADQGMREKYEAQDVAWRVHFKAPRGKELTAHQELSNDRRSRIRSRGEHAFGMVKNTWKHRKVRYRGLIKNGCQLLMLFTLANLSMARYLLKGPEGQYLLA